MARCKQRGGGKKRNTTMTVEMTLAEGESMLDPKAYRDAMSEIASPVHLIATDGVAGLAGMTVTALASISDQPPTMRWETKVWVRSLRYSTISPTRRAAYGVAILCISAGPWMDGSML